MKKDILDEASIFLLKNGFTVKKLTRTCFDIVARKNTQILLIKTLQDANAVSEQYANEMIKVSSYIHATPIIISEKAGDNLQDNVIYLRFNVFTLNFHTLINIINNKRPFIRRTKAGLTASLAGKKLKETRENMNLSLNKLAQKVGVSKRMISKYEGGTSEITINKALKIYEIFGEMVFHKVNIFEYKMLLPSLKKTDIAKKYTELGFEAADTNKVPFDIIAKKDKEIILTKVGDNKISESISLSKLIDADNLVIFKKKKPKDVPSLTKKEFMEFEKANELIRFLKDF